MTRAVMNFDTRLTEAIEPVSRIVLGAFCVFVFSVPLEYPVFLELQLDTVTGAIFLLVTLFVQPATAFRRVSPALVFLGIYLWVYLMLAISSSHVLEATNMFLHFLLVAFVFWAGSNLLRDRLAATAMILSFVLGCLVVASLEGAGVKTTVLDPGDTARRTVLYQDANLLGGNMALAMVAVLTMVYGVGKSGLMLRAAAVGVTLVLGHTLMASGSRSALLALVAGIAAFAAGATTARSLAKHAVVAVLAAAVVLSAAYEFEPVRKRFEKTAETGNMAGREEIYPEAWQIFLEKPLLGWGPMEGRYELRLRTYGYEAERRKPPHHQRDAHNLALEVLIATGVAGAVPLFLCILLCVGAAWRARRGPYGAAPLALIVVILVVSMSANWAASKQLWLLLSLGVANDPSLGYRRRSAATARSQGITTSRSTEENRHGDFAPARLHRHAHQERSA